jgi:transcription termination factor NusB
MWNLLKKSEDACTKLQNSIEEAVAVLPAAKSVEALSEVLSPEERAHMASCEQCREAARDLLATREIFEGIGSAAEMANPWFATRVMAGIAARERELAEAASPWLAVPKFASRLALVSGALLLVASTWLYERPSAVSAKQPAAAASQEYLFEAPPPPVNQDDVLISLAEQNQ